ncbi:SIR2 family protein [Rhodanobacter denitrificans]|uniref:NAD(+) hydrolase ThsA n=1 Tax=Rhodanobacter denitrificans TaxID=666685 RepID=M4NHR6_9GAMM|nr:SIR2 family protein [Rhodanobacter denitrificans]AGG89637.1 hypothetical protein R2APBS1_2551 [Rhodanobacter denitrificans]UJM85037.1 SIR2 family protein [Rhodanobacter denitrificans]
MAGFSREIEAFIKDFVGQIANGTGAIFAGAGMSRGAGYVDWKELLHDIAEELGLELQLEHDLIAVAQYHYNLKKGPAGLVRKIIEEFSHQAEETESHRILARLPIPTWWTTNYDALIEKALERAFRIADVKFNVDQLSNTRPRRDAVIYKMHGDASDPKKAILYKSQYEQYHKTHEGFITALRGDLVTKTFLFIGFSFTDPNLDYVLSRLPAEPSREHYCFVRKVVAEEGESEASVNYRTRREKLRNDDLHRYGITALEVDEYEDIPRILAAIEERYRMKTVFISGSAHEFGDWAMEEAQGLLHRLSAALIRGGYRVITGFGWGVGSAVINGALETIYLEPAKYSEDQLVMRPFPQFASNGKDLPVLWDSYRRRMIALAGTAIFVFGNKVVDGKVVKAGGVRAEYDIARELGVVPLPIAATGFVAADLAGDVLADVAHVYGQRGWIADSVKELEAAGKDAEALIGVVLKFMERIGK